MFGAVKTSGSAVGNSCVATFQVLPGGCTNVTRAGRSNQPRANISAAGMLMCACIGVDAEVGAVDAIAEDLVGDHRRCRRDRRRPTGGDSAASARIGCPLPFTARHVEHVLGELVERIAARRRARHAHLQRARPARPRNVTSTCIQRCSGAGNDSLYSTGACAHADELTRRMTMTARNRFAIPLSMPRTLAAEDTEDTERQYVGLGQGRSVSPCSAAANYVD